MTPFEKQGTAAPQHNQRRPWQTNGSARIGPEDFARLTIAAQQSCSPNVSAVL